MAMRKRINKRAGARRFRKDTMRTNSQNLAGPSMRGGWRL